MPLAAASIGQAHAATLWDGTEVVVKIRRPGVVEQVNEDLEILKELAATASRHLKFADQYDLAGLVEQFSQTLRSELDYIREGHSAERFAANFANDPRVHVPRVFWEASTARVLTLERIRGIKINDLAGLDQQGIDRRWLAQYAASVVLKMVCDDGFFHADPHPGNFFIEPNGVIGVIDFGDTVRSAVIFDPAVAMANLLGRTPDQPWADACTFMAGYDQARPVRGSELSLLPVAALARLTLRALITNWRAELVPDRRDYLLSHAKDDWTNVEQAMAVPPGEVAAQLLDGRPGGVRRHGRARRLT